MSIDKLKDSQIADNIRRYRERGLIEGGHYSLADLLAEQARRNPTPFEVDAVIAAIIEGSKRSTDGLVTYGDLWKRFTDAPWVGNHSQQQVANALGRVVHHCRRHDMPILTTLVVQAGSRSLGKEAKENIFEEARELGYDTGVDKEKFIQEQRAQSLVLVQAA